VALHEEIGLRFRRTVRRLAGAEIERLAGDLAAAEAELRTGYEALEAMGESGVRPVFAAYLAEVLLSRGGAGPRQPGRARCVTRRTSAAIGSASFEGGGPNVT
jgi:hypothetical protein